MLGVIVGEDSLLWRVSSHWAFNIDRKRVWGSLKNHRIKQEGSLGGTRIHRIDGMLLASSKFGQRQLVVEN